MIEIQKSISYRQKVYEELKKAIIKKDLLPGDILNERKLSKKLNVSRTPIREAVQMLEVEGWVTVEPWKGIIINSLTEKEINEIYIMRSTLECLAIKLLIEKIDNVTLENLEQAILEMKKLKNVEFDSYKYTVTDLKFHRILVEATDLKLLINWHDNICDMMTRLSIDSLDKNNNRFKEALEEHEKILLSIRTHDEETAVKEMKNHIYYIIKNYHINS